ncbi:helix-turn-helix transcriptional regulator [Curtobacterium aurantiacum]|uniref:helix-turn-helix transcriptional regulator n=1 Tax=Curtobacterium aurantiacum TaxID=3236919 RepID=UPI001BDFE9A4|nr:helix-turn-helix domain-containing protein [Curtobacterium flaccumfaciens]MBT1676787.1 DNA-binding protein [Curtobacterium flaccumfaciens pv. flaccumfaciens]
MAAVVVLLTLTETAERIRRTPAALRYMIHKGTAPRSALLAGRRFFKESDVTEWVESAFQEAS